MFELRTREFLKKKERSAAHACTYAFYDLNKSETDEVQHRLSGTLPWHFVWSAPLSAWRGWNCSFPSSVPGQSFPFGDVTHLFIRPCADTTDMLGAGQGMKTGGGTNLLPWRSWLVARRWADASPCMLPMMSVVSQDNYDPSMHGFGTENSQTARFLRSSIGNSACVRLLCTTDTSGPALAATAGAAVTVTVPSGFRKNRRCVAAVYPRL